MAGNVHEFTDDNFKSEVLESAEPVLVDFGRRGAALVVKSLQ